MTGSAAGKKETTSAMSQFQWDDPFLLDMQITDEDRLIRDGARAYAQQKLLPRIIEAYAQEKTGRSIFNEMGALVFLGMTHDIHALILGRAQTGQQAFC